MTQIRPRSVWAEEGSWTVEYAGGRPSAYIGRFAPEGRAALGTLTFLKRSGIVSPGHRVERDGEALVITLRRHYADPAHPGDNLEKFRYWADKRQLLPPMALHDEPPAGDGAPAAPAFPPPEAAAARSLINRLPWTAVDTTPATYGALVATTSSPEEAYQAGYYLHLTGLLPDTQWEYLHRRIREQLAHPDPDCEFRIAVPDEHWRAFTASFPHAGGREPAREEWAVLATRDPAAYPRKPR